MLNLIQSSNINTALPYFSHTKKNLFSIWTTSKIGQHQMSKIQVLWPSSCRLKLSLSKRAEEKKYDKNKNVGLIRLTCLLTCLGKYFLPVKQFFFELIILVRCYSMQHPLSQFPHKIAFSSWVFNSLRMTKIIYFSKNSDCGVNSEIGSYYSSQICMQIKEKIISKNVY